MGKSIEKYFVEEEDNQDGLIVKGSVFTFTPFYTVVARVNTGLPNWKELADAIADGLNKAHIVVVGANDTQSV